MVERIGQELGNKLSAKSFGWSKGVILEAVMANKTSDIFLYRVGGVATGLRKFKIPVAQQKDGETEGFGLSGMFKAIGADGEEKSGSVLYLPRYVHDMVEAALSVGEDVSGVRIGFDIYARYNEDAATSYVFLARDILNEGNSALDSVVETLDKLPMPNSAPALEDKSGSKSK